MTKISAHARIPLFPYAVSLQGARLEGLREEIRGRQHDLVMEYQEFSVQVPPELVVREGKLYERAQGETIPRRLRFQGVRDLQVSWAYKKLDRIPFDHPVREIRDILHWIPAGHHLPFYLLFNSSQEQDGLSFHARQVIWENFSAQPGSFSVERDWSSPPPTRAGLVPHPKKLYQRYGGDPVTIWLKARPYHRRLFIGGLDVQPEGRPDIDAVLNLGEEPSRWARNKKLPASDRWVSKGEGIAGMGPDEIRFEANWVIERLKAGERVLVHCIAGMNRSSTICCAVLMSLEGLSAEAALARVREHHPWARPDSHHWLALRWLADGQILR